MSRHSSENEYPTEDPRPEDQEEEQQEEGSQQSKDDNKSDDDLSEHPSDTESMAEMRKEARDGGKDFNAKPTAGGFNVALCHTICSFVSFALMLTAACPVQWMKAGNGDAWTVWKNPAKVRWTDIECDHEKQMFQAMEAFSIIAVVSSLASFIVGILYTCGCGHLGVMASFGFFTMAMDLVCWALITNQYHAYRCPGQVSYVHRINRLYAGFALSVCSFGLMFCSVVASLYYIYTNFAVSESAKTFSYPAIGSCVLTLGSLAITVVGCAEALWVQYFPTYTVKLTLWHVEIENRDISLSEFYSYKDYNCKGFNTYMKAGQAFAIISSAVLFLAWVFNVGAVNNKICKIVAIIMLALSAVFLLICWAILVAARYKTFCKGEPGFTANGMYGIPSGTNVTQEVSFTGYHIVDGLAMFISAFCISIVNMIFLIIS